MFKHSFNNKGVSVVEYALLAALIGTASVLGVTTLGTQTASLFEREDLRLADSNGGDNSSGGSAGSGDGLGDHRATQNLDMSLFRIVNVDDPLNPSDAATKDYVDTAVSSISTSGDDLGNHTATQNLNLATNRIVNLAAPQDASDAATKSYVDGAVFSSLGDDLGDHQATQILDMGTFRISDVGAPVAATDAATKGYVDSAIANISSGDDFGSHVATQNITMGSNWISNDGTNNGIQISPTAVTASLAVVAPNFNIGASGEHGYFATGSINGPALGDFRVNVGNASGSLIFDNNGTQRMRLSSNAVMLGTTTTPGSGLMAGTAASGTYWSWGPSRAAIYDVYYIINQNATGVYLPSGATGWFAHSDERVKNIIEPISNASAKVISLRSVIGAYKTDPEQKRRPFLIAQDVESVLPEAVFRNPDALGTLGVSYTDIVPLLVASQKEMIDEIATLKARIEYLESR